jgi:hypothetical protein
LNHGYGRSWAKAYQRARRVFSHTVWWWRPLADYCNDVAPEICAACEHWHSHDYDGLDAAGATALANALEIELHSGRTEAFAKEHETKREAAPDVPCDICEGTGVRRPRPRLKPGVEGPFLDDDDYVEPFDHKKHLGAGDPRNGGIKCNGCNGTGRRPPDIAHYPFSVENVTEFVAFLRQCGGFSIG